ncbi:acetoacetyl-CoA reductase [Phenylobacterium montanum]|uniref:Acetoacetyl-CoA reductase n=1 Tax=Phenylobacterium montanum TaxID=2823693 RepID=A0A975G3A5_9CAUL|nr:acetoacetyl-CoA reductase [Caulobacter sp. S6]QUD89901.1 acetoacetyl-CoA reductase [Caulobacter sp. S6]
MTRVAVVTGGTRGIGRAICQQLKADGLRVAAFYAGNDEAARACREELDILALKCDVAESLECRSALKEVEELLGPIDVLVNNAGVTHDMALHKMEDAAWDQVIRVDLSGLYNMTRPVIGGMRERGHGRIVNIASINGQKGQFGQTNYAAAKAGVIGFTKALALETARKGITVNAVAPGYIDTDMVAHVPAEVLTHIKADIPVGRLGQPEEVARCVAFLAAEGQGFITGATLTINGGQYMV